MKVVVVTFSQENARTLYSPNIVKITGKNLDSFRFLKSLKIAGPKSRLKDWLAILFTSEDSAALDIFVRFHD